MTAESSDLDDEIAWWTAHAHRLTNEAGMVAFGVATGLKIARADYGARGKRSKKAEEERSRDEETAKE